jgi:hypothetical protein
MNTTAEQDQALDVLLSVELSVSWLVWPVSLITLIVLGHRSYTQKRFLDTLPLLFIALNSTIIYGCLAAATTCVFI